MKCNPTWIDEYLADRLDGDTTSELELHLEQCPACRQRLCTHAAEETWWNEAHEYLTESPWDPPTGAELAEGTSRAVLERDVVAFLHPTDDPRMLGRLGSYEIVGLIGMGGMGVVLKGFDAALNRYVAIKVLSPHLASSAAARSRFAREAQAAAAVVHEHVVPIHGVAEHRGLPYLVMPYIRGESLQRRLDRSAPLTVVEAVRIARQCAAALAAAHTQGLVHRDIKPANILLDEGVERVRITDFGLARAVDDASLTRTGVVAGTPQFMSPEQASGEALDHRSDLFSLGSVLYMMLTGRLPFRAETSLAVLRRITDTQPRSLRELNPAVPVWLEGIVVRLHEKQAERRFQSASDVEHLLGRCLQHLQDPRVSLPEELSPSRLTTLRHAYPSRVMLASGLAVLAIAIVTVVALWPEPRATRALPAAGHAPVGAERAIDSTSPHPIATTVPSSQLSETRPSETLSSETPSTAVGPRWPSDDDIADRMTTLRHRIERLRRDLGDAERLSE